jgi:glycosyltransferase involved in cell wall biosynthesis
MGGVELHLLQMSRELTRRGHVFDLCYEEDGDLSDSFRSFCGSLTKVPSIRYTESPVSDARRVLSAARTAIRLRPDLIYVNHATELAWAVAVQAFTRAPIVCWLHVFIEYQPGSLQSRLVPLLARRVNRFLAVSEFIRDQWQEQSLGAAAVDVVPNGVSLADYPTATTAELRRCRELLGVPANAYVVLYPGRLVPEKGVDVLLDAWRELGLPADRARLLIVGLQGDSDQSEYVRQLQAGSPPGCSWLPMRADVVSMLHATDVVVLPARWEEPFGRVIIEAMATGRPAVGARVGGIPEILDGEFARFLFPREDSAALADRLRELQDWRVSDPGLAERCVEHVNERFSLEATATRVEAVLQSARESR